VKNRYRLVLAYDGTSYHGWQEQKDVPTITQVLRKSFTSVFNQDARLFGVSRTDAGVHARGQVAVLQTNILVTPKKMHFALNNALPDDIVIRSIEKIDRSFHLHANIETKLYYYYFFSHRPKPFVQRYGWYFHKSFNLEKLKKSLHIFVGTHDFRSFSTGDERDGDTVRTIKSIDLSYCKKLGAHRITVSGPKFLHHMVRRIVGACLDVASRDEMLIFCLKKALDERDSKQTLLNAPAKGLVLHKVEYSKTKKA